MKHVPHGSLRYFFSIPQVKPQDMSKVMVPVAAAKIKAAMQNATLHGMAKPDLEAIEFYCMNHLVAEIRKAYDQDEILPAWAQKIVERYVQVLAEQGLRMFAYMTLIITREARHMHSSSVTSLFYNQFSDAFKKFHATILGASEGYAPDKFCQKGPKMPLAEYVGNIVDVFNKGKFSSSYGGKPWGNIAKTLHRMLVGETSIEQMVDSAYSLAHNGGPMFNKGMLYHGYSSEFIKILDVQRSGQMPEAVINSEFKHLQLPQHLRTHVESLLENMPKAFGERVDWVKVEASGVRTYPTEKSAMPKTPLKPIYIGNKLAKKVGVFMVLPGKEVTIFKRVNP